MDILCTDKTGTLTLGVVKLDGAMDINGEPSEQVSLYAYLNASLQTGLQNLLDEAIVNKGTQRAEEYKKLDEIPYDFIRKRMTVVVEKNNSDPFMIYQGRIRKYTGGMFKSSGWAG